MQETETKIKKTILGDIKVASHRNEKYNRTKSRDSKKRENSSERKSAWRRKRLRISKENKNKVTPGKLCVLHRCCVSAGSTEFCYVFFLPFLLLILHNQIAKLKFYHYSTLNMRFIFVVQDWLNFQFFETSCNLAQAAKEVSSCRSLRKYFSQKEKKNTHTKQNKSVKIIYLFIISYEYIKMFGSGIVV